MGRKTNSKNKVLLVRNKPIMDYEAVRDNVSKCAIQEKEYCLKCKYYTAKDCRSRLMFEAAHAMNNLIAERNGETWKE